MSDRQREGHLAKAYMRHDELERKAAGGDFISSRSRSPSGHRSRSISPPVLRSPSSYSEYGLDTAGISYGSNFYKNDYRSIDARMAGLNSRLRTGKVWPGLTNARRFEW